MQEQEQLLAQAVALHKAGKLEEASKAYLQIINLNPQHAHAIHLLGVLAAQNRKWPQAINLITHALSINPEAPAFHFNLGKCLGAVGRYEEEERHYKRALDLQPDYEDAYNELMRILLRKEEAKEEREALQKKYQHAQNKIAFKQYQDSVVSTRSTAFMEYPAHVHMETMAKCNAACNFCPYPVLERKGDIMSDKLINKIINDLSDIPREIAFQLSPFKVNEPFLDVRLFDILGRINEQLPNAAITLTTNASPVTEKNLVALSKVQNINSLWISFNDHREKEYETTMQLPYKRTIERLTAIHNKLVERALPFEVYLSRVGDGSVADQDFKTWVSQRYPLFKSSVIKRGSWIGQVAIDQEVPDVGCSRWYELSITASGIVAHCCMDGQAKWPIGDVRTQHVLEIYNNPEYRRLREHTQSRWDVSPCNQCAFL